jgi:3-phosphoshikimate 1-carboxyvinyltransferase
VTAQTIDPGPVRGRLVAPPSKSYTHRGLVVGYLSRRPFVLRSPLDSDDTRATAVALRRLGARVSMGRRRWTVSPPRRHDLRRPATVDCGESGTTLRFATVLAALGPRPVHFRGRGRLGHRPMRPLVRALTALGAVVRPSSGQIPFTVHGPIRGGRVSLDASESSQFASALLLGLPTVEGKSQLDLEGQIVSEPYLEATLAVLRRCGVRVSRRGRTIRLRGGQGYGGDAFHVPGDASSAAYLWTAGAVGGGPVTVQGVDRSWPQADLAILDVLARAGAEVVERRASITVRSGRPRPFSVDLTDCPDLYPLAGVLAATIPGTSRLRGAPHVVHKESNRRAETVRLVSAFGARVKGAAGGLEVRGIGRLRAIDLPNLSDHRIVMSAAVGALAATGSSRIGGAESVRKSYPGFWEAFRAIGAEVRRS